MAVEVVRDEILKGLSEEVDKVVATKAALTTAGVAPPSVGLSVSSAQAAAIADQIIHRASAAMADVHAHAMSRVASMRAQLDELERTIQLAKETSEKHMQRFMALCADGEEAVHEMEKACTRVSDHLYNS